MNIAEVSTEELSRWYAEKMEPDFKHMKSRPAPESLFWQCAFGGSGWHWKPRDLTTPEMTLRLMKHSGFAGIIHSQGSVYVASFSRPFIATSSVTDSPERAILEAACLAEGWGR